MEFFLDKNYFDEIRNATQDAIKDNHISDIVLEMEKTVYSA